MRITKLGQIPEDKVIQATCLKCKTEVEFTLNDEEVSLENDNRNGSYARLVCPLCANVITKDL